MGGPKNQLSGPKAHQTPPEGLKFEGRVAPTNFSIYRHPTIVLLQDPLHVHSQELPADEDHEQDATEVVDIPVSPKHLEDSLADQLPPSHLTRPHVTTFGMAQENKDSFLILVIRLHISLHHFTIYSTLLSPLSQEMHSIILIFHYNSRYCPIFLHFILFYGQKSKIYNCLIFYVDSVAIVPTLKSQ